VATRLNQVLSFLNVPAGNQATLPHLININGVAVQPDILFPDNDNFSFVSSTPTTITVLNNGSLADNLNLWLWRQHSIDRAYGAKTTTNLVPNPFWVGSFVPGGGGTVPPRIVNFVATGGEQDFMVNIGGAPMVNDNYGLLWSPAGTPSAIPVLDLPNVLAGDRTTTQFRVETLIPLSAGDKLTFVLFPV
jgi:hypothetical protein